MLKRLKEQKQGSALVDPCDCPEELYPSELAGANNGYTDNTIHERWAWMLDELIWTFTQLLPDCKEQEKYYSEKGVTDEYWEYDARIQRGLMLFGKYFRGLWD
jgi:hypothetical protein